MGIMPSKPRVAVVGAGLTGLSAAYFLRDRAVVTIFEKEMRTGGRVFTSVDPPGEHGAQFFLSSENFICSVLKELDIKCVEANREPWYFFGEKFAGGGPEKAARELLPQPLEKQLNQFLRLVRQGPPWPATSHHFHQWLSNYFGGNREAITFFEMILVGETNARGNQVTTHYGLDCLYSCFCENWFRIRGY